MSSHHAAVDIHMSFGGALPSEDARPGQADADRALTREGKQKLRALLRRLARGGVRPALILTSPYLRARQSAEIARDVLAPDAMIVPARALSPGSTPQRLAPTLISTRLDSESR